MKKLVIDLAKTETSLFSGFARFGCFLQSIYTATPEASFSFAKSISLQVIIFTRSGIQMPRSSKTILSKLTRLSKTPPKRVLISSAMLVVLVNDNPDDFCFDAVSFPDERRPSAVKIYCKTTHIYLFTHISVRKCQMNRFTHSQKANIVIYVHNNSSVSETRLRLGFL